MNVTEEQLATLWPVMAAQEGHKPRVPNNMEFRLRQQNGRVGAKAANFGHYNTRRSLKNQALCLTAIRKGYVTSPAIAKATGLTNDVVRRMVYRLEDAGKVSRKGTMTVKGGTAVVWKVNE